MYQSSSKSKDNIYLQNDAYSIENANRILSTLQAVIRSDANSLFDTGFEGSFLSENFQNPTLVIAREDKIEIRKIDNPNIVVATLNMGNKLDFRALDIFMFKGEKAICICNNEHAYIWNPQRASTPIADFTVSEPYGIDSISNILDGKILKTILTTISGPIYELDDFTLKEKWKPISNKYITDPVLFQNGMLFGLVEGNLQIIAIDLKSSDRKINYLLDEEILKTYIQNFPDIAAKIDNRLTKDYEYLSKEWSSEAKQLSWTGLNFQDPSLYKLNLNGKELFCLQTKIYFFTASSTLIVLFNIAENNLKINGYFYLDDANIANFHFYLGNDGRPGLIYAVLSDFKKSYDLVGWARAFQTANDHFLFVTQGSTLRTYDDMMNVVRFSDEIGFASDDSGGLFKLSIAKKDFSEINRNKLSNIKSLSILDYSAV